MQRPDSGEYSETEKQHGKRPRLQLRRKLELRQLIQIQRSGSYVCDENPDEYEHAAKKRIERQLHRPVFLVGRSEDGNKKILRHDYQLVEREEQKQIRAQKNSVAASHNEQQPEEKFVLPMFDVP